MSCTMFEHMKRLGLVSIASLSMAGTALAADAQAYLLTHVGNDFDGQSQVSTIDLSTGAIAHDLDLTLNGTAVTTYTLGLLPGTSSYFTGIGDSYYSVDMHTGQLTLDATTHVLGSLSEGFVSTTTGLYEETAALEGNMVHYELYSVDVGTGLATDIGSAGSTPEDTSGESSSAPGLYVLDDDGPMSTSILASVNVSTGQRTLVGNTGVVDMTSLVSVNGTFYGLAGVPGDAIYRVDPATAVSTFVTSLGSFPGEYGELAPFVSSAVPEPQAWLLSLLGFGVVVRRRRSPGCGGTAMGASIAL